MDMKIPVFFPRKHTAGGRRAKPLRQRQSIRIIEAALQKKKLVFIHPR
jgi:hypothetical protein